MNKKPNIGELCFAFVDSKYNRAYIINEKDSTSYLVNLLDWGHFKYLKLNQLYSYNHRDSLKLEYKSLSCCLLNSKQKEIIFNEAQRDKFFTLTRGLKDIEIVSNFMSTNIRPLKTCYVKMKTDNGDNLLDVLLKSSCDHSNDDSKVPVMSEIKSSTIQRRKFQCSQNDSDRLFHGRTGN